VLVEMACECIVCEYCKGTGTVWESPFTHEITNYRWDDLYDMVGCPVCDGQGVTSICDECIREYEEEEEGKECW